MMVRSEGVVDAHDGTGPLWRNAVHETVEPHATETGRSAECRVVGHRVGQGKVGSEDLDGAFQRRDGPGVEVTAQHDSVTSQRTDEGRGLTGPSASEALEQPAVSRAMVEMHTRQS